MRWSRRGGRAPPEGDRIESAEEDKAEEGKAEEQQEADEEKAEGKRAGGESTEDGDATGGGGPA